MGIKQVEWIEHSNWLELEGKGEGVFVINVSRVEA